MKKLFHYNKCSKQCALIKIVWSFLKLTDGLSQKKKENGDILEISDLRFQVCIENDVNIQ